MGTFNNKKENIILFDSNNDEFEFNNLSNSEKVLILNSEKIIDIENKLNKQQELINTFLEKSKTDYKESFDLIKDERSKIFNEIEEDLATKKEIELDKKNLLNENIENNSNFITKYSLVNLVFKKINDLNIFFSKKFSNIFEVKKFLFNESIYFIKDNIINLLDKEFNNKSKDYLNSIDNYEKILSNLNFLLFSIDNKFRNNINNDRKEIVFYISDFILEKNTSEKDFTNIFLYKTEIEFLLKKFIIFILLNNLTINALEINFNLINIQIKKFNEFIDSNICLNKDNDLSINDYKNYKNFYKYNDKITNNVNLNESNFIEESDEDMKNNYYGNQDFIPGTKITKIKNYKYNNDSIEINNDYDKEISNNVSSEVDTNILLDQIKSSTNFQNNLNEENINRKIWEESNQKLLDLENLILKQEEEIDRLKNNKDLSGEISSKEQSNFISNKDNSDKIFNDNKLKSDFNSISDGWYDEDNNSLILKNINESIIKALEKIDELSKIQEKNILEIENVNKKINSIDLNIKNDFEKDKFNFNSNEEKFELEKLIQEKYKTNVVDNKIINNNSLYLEEYKKLEDERKKINETLELEKIRLLSELEFNKAKLLELQQDQISKNNSVKAEEKKEIIQEQEIIEPVKPIITSPFAKKNIVVSSQQQPPLVILEAPKKKRKQQMFFEIKLHDTPKLTRADIEK